MIDIVVSNGVACLWNPADWRTLRTDHRIIGNFDGALPVMRQTNRVLPLRLNTVQTQYLLRSGIARTVESSKLYSRKELASVDKDKFLERRNQHKVEQMSQYKKTKRLELEAMVDKIIEGKRKKGRGLVPDKSAVIQDELAKITALPYEFIKVDLQDPWNHNEQDFQPYAFPEPVSERDRLRLDVFEDFCNERKYYLTSGIAFGGDFLAYPGDPLEYHSEFIIICRLSTQVPSKISLISHQRLAQTVKKTLLIAFYDEDGRPKYDRIVSAHSTEPVPVINSDSQE